MSAPGHRETGASGGVEMAGRAPRRRAAKSSDGVTLLEMLIVVALIGLVVGISFPAVTAGVDSLRLSSAGDGAASLINGALNRADRRQEAVEIVIDTRQNALVAQGLGSDFRRRLEMPPGVRIAGVSPPLLAESDEPRRFVVYPGGAPPRISLDLVNAKGARRSVRVDPVTGVPQVERLAAP
ncbi:MAG: prepilin-type N-terminal cleavage/methylation domain-containing protein [Bryobacterales bacterium]|nr:prepilin-type N-terminal cleavage/methylation domain-containing protein [Bryobacterales bacterium]